MSSFILDAHLGVGVVRRGMSPAEGDEAGGGEESDGATPPQAAMRWSIVPARPPMPPSMTLKCPAWFSRVLVTIV